MKQTEETNQLVSWYDSWGEGLFRLAFYRLASRQDAEDVVQDAFLKISGMNLQQIGNPKAYLYRAVQNGCNDLLRRIRPQRALDEGILHTPEAEDWEAQCEAERINHLLEHLPEEHSEVIRLHLYGALRFTEIAELLGVPASTLKSRFTAGIERLRKMLNN